MREGGYDDETMKNNARAMLRLHRVETPERDPRPVVQAHPPNHRPTARPRRPRSIHPTTSPYSPGTDLNPHGARY